MQELELSHTEFGLIGASFFTFFSLGAVVVGFLVNRVDTKWVLATLVLIWSLCQLPMLLPLSAAALIVSRVVLGFSEGPAYPVALHAAYKWFPPEHRAVPTSVIAIGALAGKRNRGARDRLDHYLLVVACGFCRSRCSRPRLVRDMAGCFPRRTARSRCHDLGRT
jgi:nitrate/nitrite transporter NarK